MSDRADDNRPDPPARRGSGRPEPSVHLNRRGFIALTAVGGAATAAVALGIVEAESGGAPKAATGSDRPKLPRKSKVSEGTTGTRQTTLVDGVRLPTSPYIVAENAKTGHAWWVTTPQADRGIEGFASQVSASIGDTVTLFVSTKATQFHVEAYRMGYYQGIGGRLVWMSGQRPGVQQPLPELIPSTNTIECRWEPSLTFTIDLSWPPGAYLLKLVGSTDEQQFVPLCVRDDTSQSAIVIQHSVTTWQAYNRWGGYSLYYGNTDGALSFTHDPAGGTYGDRARVVSFDRPYDYDWASGAADFVGNELPVIFQAERLGLDVTYWTDVDLHANPHLLDNHRALDQPGARRVLVDTDAGRCRRGRWPRGSTWHSSGRTRAIGRSDSSRRRSASTGARFATSRPKRTR